MLDTNKDVSNNKKRRFDIWSLYNLQSNFINEIKLLDLNLKLENNIISWERQKIKILRYNLDSSYSYKIIQDDNFIFIHHLWHGELFDIDQYNLNTNNIMFKNKIEYTLGNVFDMIMNKIINKQYDLNNDLIISIIINIYPFARFNYMYFKYICDNCKYLFLKDKVASRILLYNLIDEKCA